MFLGTLMEVIVILNLFIFKGSLLAGRVNETAKKFLVVSAIVKVKVFIVK